MEIHNLMEELVVTVVDEAIAEDAAGDHRYCTSPDCRTDVICYVLNRMTPRYVSSGRGFAHLVETLESDTQVAVDLVRLAHEGLQRVTAVRRTWYDSERRGSVDGACYNFPTIQGRVLDGAGFMPLASATVTLVMDDAPIPMYDTRWTNPYTIDARTPGTYIFWPASVPAAETDASASFELHLRIEAPGYESLTHQFSLELERAEHPDPVFSLEREHRLPDLYLFPG